MRKRKKTLLMAFVLVLLQSTVLWTQLITTVGGDQSISGWTSPQLLVDNDIADHNPSIIQDSGGKYWVSWASGSNVYPQYYDVWIMSSDDGVDWVVPSRVTNSTDALDPYLLQDASGNYLIAYLRNLLMPAGHPSSYEIWTITSNNGIEWGTPISTGLTTPGTTGGYYPSILQDSEGKYRIIYCKWERVGARGYYRVMCSSSDDFINWNTPVQICSHGYNPSLIQDSAGTYRAVWKANAHAIWASTSNDGVIWSTPSQLSVDVTTDFAGCLSLIQDNGGTYWLAWDSGFPEENPDIFLSSSNDFVTWSAPQQLTTHIRLDQSPSLLHDSNGVYWVVWHAWNRRDNYDVWCARAQTVISCDKFGDDKDTFLPSEDVYVKGSGYPADKEVAIYVIPDGYDATPGNAKTVTYKTTESGGTLAVTLVWSHALDLGDYDIWVDVNRNNVFDDGDVSNDVAISVFAFLVVPEPIAVVGMLLMFAALTTFYFTKKRNLPLKCSL